MFDRLIESDAAGADFRSRRRYFLVSTVVVGALFISAVVFSIYASDIGLGADEFEISTLLAPVESAATEPEPPHPQVNRTTSQTSAVAQRPTNTLRPDESPSEIPPISVSPNDVAARPNMPFNFGEFKDPPSVPADYQPTVATGSGSGNTGPQASQAPTVTDKNPEGTEPPPLVEKPKAPRHIGIVNGIAINLPKPPYPAPAVAMNIQGKVDVQVTIDENGKVISAKAASGHPFLRDAAERAARNARFSTTFLNGSPIKVTGVIVYNFTRN